MVRNRRGRTGIPLATSLRNLPGSHHMWCGEWRARGRLPVHPVLRPQAAEPAPHRPQQGSHSPHHLASLVPDSRDLEEAPLRGNRKREGSGSAEVKAGSRAQGTPDVEPVLAAGQSAAAAAGCAETFLNFRTVRTELKSGDTHPACLGPGAPGFVLGRPQEASERLVPVLAAGKSASAGPSLVGQQDRQRTDPARWQHPQRAQLAPL